jgi:hypothetical protein
VILTAQQPPTAFAAATVAVQYAPSPLRHREQIPPWVIALLILAAVLWISPFGLIVALVMISIFLTAHPTIAIAIGGTIMLVVIIAMRERWYGRRF